MERLESRKDNKLDQTLSIFTRQYRYEILASLGLVSLLGGIVLAAKVFDNQEGSNIQVFSTTSQALDEEASKIWVDVTGAVVNSGIYEFESGSRVKDAIEKAGGLTDDADREWLNQFLNRADFLKDGQKIYVPSEVTIDDESESVLAQGHDAIKSPRISINRASLDEIMELPGIGQTYAERIINGRPYNSIEDLLDIPGIGSKRFEQIKDLITVY